MSRASVVLPTLILLGGLPLGATNKYVAIGDSITAGSSWPFDCGICPVIFDCTGGCAATEAGREDCGQVRRLESWLGAGHEVFNEGVAGQTTSGALSLFASEMDAHCPSSSGDCIGVLLMHGTNDLGGAISPETTRDNLAAMIGIAKARHLDVLLMSVIRKVYDFENTKWLDYRDLVLALAASENLQSVDSHGPLCDDNTDCYNTNYWVDHLDSQCTAPGEGDTPGNGAVGHLDPDGYDVLTDLVTMAFPPAVPGAPSGIAPEGDIGETAPSFVWPDEPTSRWYELEVDGSSTWWEAAESCSAGTCSADPSVGLAAGPHSWRIRGRNLRGLGAWSTGKSFVIWEVPGEPVPAAPTGVFMDFDPLAPPYGWEPFTWNTPDNATEYDLVVSNGEGLVVEQSFDSSICSESSCGASPGVGLPFDDYTWTVRARNPALTGPTSAEQAFSVVCDPASRDLSDFVGSPVTGSEIIDHCGPLVAAALGPFTIDASGDLTVTTDQFIAQDGLTVIGVFTVGSH